MNFWYQFLKLLFIAGIAISSAPKSYSGHKMLRFTLQNDVQMKVLEELVKTSNHTIEIMKKVNYSKVDVLVSPDSLDVLTIALGSDYEVLVDDVQEKIDKMKPQRKPEKRHELDYFLQLFADYQKMVYGDIFADYHDSDTLADYLVEQDIADEIIIGETFEGRPIRGVTFGTGELQIVMTGGVHAREWISPATVTYVSTFLMGDNEEAVALREKFTFHVIPVLNLDGYYYSRTQDRLWRKNREYNENSDCAGVDINRNFAYKWGQDGASADPCDETYRGDFPMSSLEAQSLDYYISELQNVVCYLDIHSYGQQWIYPWDNIPDLPPNQDDLRESAAIGAAALGIVYGTYYQAGNSFFITYATSGTTEDHFYATRNVSFSMTLELRDTGVHGFLLPPELIVPTAEETLQGLMAFWNYIYARTK